MVVNTEMKSWCCCASAQGHWPLMSPLKCDSPLETTGRRGGAPLVPDVTAFQGNKPHLTLAPRGSGGAVSGSAWHTTPVPSSMCCPFSSL